MKIINNRNKLWLNLAGLFMIMFSVAGNSAFASCSGATMITSLPYYATSPGTYCLANDMTFITTWNSAIAAVTISSDDVVLDLNGKTITGRWAGSTPAAGTELGVTVTGNAKNVVVRNGSLRGLKAGVWVWTNTGSNNVDNLTVEYVNISEMAGYGIIADGNSRCDNCNIRNNIITNIDANLCTTCGGYSGAYGIYMRYADNLDIADNVVFNMISRGSLGSYGIYIRNGANATLDTNTVINIPSAGQHTAIMAFLYQNMDASNNILMHFYRGIRYFYSSGIYSGTTYTNVTIPYTGGTDGGGNQ